jgi:WD40 repeat protein
VVDARGAAPEALADPRPGELQLVVTGPVTDVPADAEVRTQPLDVAQVGQLLASYLPDGSAADLEQAAAGIHARSGGNVARTRELSVQWAREQVAGRVADRTAASAGTAAAHEQQRAALAEDVLRWTALRPDPSGDPHSCPWRGLASYEEADAAWFAGRERLTAEMVARVGAARALLLVGASGSGKSSLLRAGLLASLAAGALPGSPGWVRVVLRPGEHPMRELTQAALAGAGSTGPDRVADLLSRSLAGRGAAERVLLVVDQLEECWTVCADPGERDAFLTTLADLASSPSVPITVVLAVRADHAGSIATHAALAEALAGRAVFVGPMGEGELRRAIEGPAARAGLALDTGLVDALVADTLAEPGGLPLLSAAMADLWAQREGSRLALAAYVGSGGVGAAIARLAERAYAELDEPHRRSCRVLLRRLAGPGQGDGVVRRRTALAELESLPDPLVRAVVDPLAEARLLAVSDGHVEVAHEALFRSWPRLREWLAEDATARDVQRRITVAAAEWDREGQESAGLWGGARLASAVELLAARPEEFTSVEAAFVEASAAKLDAERADAEERARVASRQNTRLRRLLGGLGITLAVALLAGALAVRSGSEAAAQRETATAQRLAATAISEDYLAQRMLTAVAGVRTEESPQTVGALLSVLAANPAIIDRIDTPNRLLGAAAAPGSDRAVAIANLESVHVFDTTTGESQVAWSEPDANLVELRVSPDGAHAAFAKASWSGQRPPDLVVLDLATGQVVWTRPLEEDPAVLTGGWDFTDTPGELAVATTDGIDLVRLDGSAPTRTIEMDRVEPQWQLMLRAGPGRMLRLAGESEPARLVDLTTGEADLLPDDISVRGTVSPDGRWLATQAPSASAAEAGPVLVVDLDAPDADPVQIPFEGDLGGAAFLPDGDTVVLGSMGGEVVVADIRSGQVREAFSGGHTGAIMGVVASPDGATAWTAGRDGDLIAWDLRGDRRLAVVRELPLAVTTGQVSADGRRAAVWAANPEGVPAQVGMLDLATAELVAGPYAQPDEPGERPNSFAAGITPDGRTLLRGAVAGPDDPARLQVIDVATGTIRHDVELPWWPNGIAATTDGSAALVAGIGGVVRVDLATGRVVARVELPEVSWYAEVQATVAPSPDGRHVAVARGPRVEILDVAELRQVRTWQAGQYDDVLALQWLDRGRALAFGGRLGRLEIRTFPDGQTEVEPRQVFPGFVLDIAASPDGSLLALHGTDGEVVLWDVAAAAPVGEPLVPGPGDAWGWVRFTPDGGAVEALYDSTRAYTYPIDTETLVTRACRIAAREPTAAEWASMHGDQPQEPLCGERAGATPAAG